MFSFEDETGPLQDDTLERDWMEVLQSHSGRKVLCFLLEQCGIGKPISMDGGSIARYNLGVDVLDRIQQIDPLAGSEILMRLYGADCPTRQEYPDA